MAHHGKDHGKKHHEPKSAAQVPEPLAPDSDHHGPAKAGGRTAVDEVVGPYAGEFSGWLIRMGLSSRLANAVLEDLSPAAVRAALLIPAGGGLIAANLPGTMFGSRVLPKIAKQMVAEAARVLTEQIQNRGGKRHRGQPQPLSKEQVADITDEQIHKAVDAAEIRVLVRKNFVLISGILHFCGADGECPLLVNGQLDKSKGRQLDARQAFGLIEKKVCSLSTCCLHELEHEMAKPAEPEAKPAKADAHQGHGHDAHGHGKTEAKGASQSDGWPKRVKDAEKRKKIVAWLRSHSDGAEQERLNSFLNKHLDTDEVEFLLEAISLQGQPEYEEHLKTTMMIIENSNLAHVAYKSVDKAVETVDDVVGGVGAELQALKQRLRKRVTTVKSPDGNVTVTATNVSFVEALTNEPKPKLPWYKAVGRFFADAFSF